MDRGESSYGIFDQPTQYSSSDSSIPFIGKVQALIVSRYSDGVHSWEIRCAVNKFDILREPPRCFRRVCVCVYSYYSVSVRW